MAEWSKALDLSSSIRKNAWVRTPLEALPFCPGLRRETRDAPPHRIPVVIDTDIGTDADDSFALALALHLPEFDVKPVSIILHFVD